MFEHSPLPHLFAVAVLIWLWVYLRRADHHRQYLPSRLLLISILSAWLTTTSWIAFNGNYLELARETTLFPLFVVLPMALVALVALISKQVRRLIMQFISNTSLATFTLINIIRIGAIGTIIHFYQGMLPAHFIIPIAFPDLVIGLSAYYMSQQARNQSHDHWLLIWHICGTLIFLSAVPLMLLSQPGLFNLFETDPNTDQVLSFPMVLVPTFVAPLLVLIHLAAITQLVNRIRHKDSTTLQTGET